MNNGNETKTTHAVYTMHDRDGQPTVTYTPYLAENGELWLACEGNGAGDDEPIRDLDGESDAWVWENYCEFDVSAMLADADELAAAGHVDDADWLRDWCDRLQRVQRGTTVDAETRADVLAELRDNGCEDDAAAIEDEDIELREVWYKGAETLYRADDVYVLIGDGEPTVLPDLAAAHAQIYA